MGKEGEDGQSMGGTEEEKRSRPREEAYLEQRTRKEKRKDNKKRKENRRKFSQGLSEGEFSLRAGLTQTTDLPTPAQTHRDTRKVTKGMDATEHNFDIVPMHGSIHTSVNVCVCVPLSFRAPI